MDATVPISVTMPVNIRRALAHSTQRSSPKSLVALQARSPAGIVVSSTGEAMPPCADLDRRRETARCGRPARRRGSARAVSAPPSTMTLEMPCAARSSSSSGSATRPSKVSVARNCAPARSSAALRRRIGLRAGGDEQRHVMRRRTSFDDSGSRHWRSSTMRAGERASSPGSRTVSSGSSASAVPMPTRIASARARISCTCRRAISPVMATWPSPWPADHAVAAKAPASEVTSGRFFEDRIR